MGEFERGEFERSPKDILIWSGASYAVLFGLVVFTLKVVPEPFRVLVGLGPRILFCAGVGNVTKHSSSDGLGSEEDDLLLRRGLLPMHSESPGRNFPALPHSPTLLVSSSLAPCRGDSDRA